MEYAEDDQLAIPTDILKEFQSLKNATNLNSGDLMKTLLSSFRKETASYSSDMDRNEEGSLYALSQQSSLPELKQTRRKTAPGQKLNRVCEILQYKRAARQQLITSFHDVDSNDVMMSQNDVMMPQKEMTSPNDVITSYKPPKPLCASGSSLSCHIPLQDDEALDLTVKKSGKGDKQLQQTPLYMPLGINDTSVTEDLCVDLTLPDNIDTPDSSWGPVKTEPVLPELCWGFAGQQPTHCVDDTTTIETPRSEVSQPSHDEVKSFLRNAVDRKREAGKPLTKRQSSRPRKSAPKQEGMRLVNENILFPGVYTGTFKLPGCRRGGRKHTIKSKIDESSQESIQRENVSRVSTLPVVTQSESSSGPVLPRKRGRPSRQPGVVISQDGAYVTKYMKIEAMAPQPQVFSQCPIPPQPSQQNTQTASTTGVIPVSNDAPVPITSQCGTLTFMLSSPPNLAQYPGTILPQQCYVTLPTNQGLVSPVNIIPMQLLPHEAMKPKTVQASAPSPQYSSNSPAPTIVAPPANQNVKIKMETSSPNQSPSLKIEDIINSESHVQDSTPIELEESTLKKGENQHEAHAFQTQSEKYHEDMRIRTLKTDLVRSDSNFYCCSFKLKPQSPEVRKGGTPAKRCRGRPKSSSDCQKTTEDTPDESSDELYHELFHCKICNLVISTTDKIAHQLSHASRPVDPNSICSTCGVSFQPVVTLGFEECIDGNDRMYCQQCTDMFSRETNKAEILKSKLSPPNKITCDKCKQVFSHQTLLLEHRKLIHNEMGQYFVCKKCDKILYSPATFRYHLLSHNADYKPIRCSVRGCLKMCRNDGELRRHLQAHIRTKDYECNYPNCSKRFQKKFHLQEHIRVKHMKIKPFSCCWSGCTKQFSGVRHLKVHMLIHNDEKPLSCEYCEYRCRQRNALNWHMRKHPEVSYLYKTSRKRRSGRVRFPNEAKKITNNVHIAQEYNAKEIP